MDFKIGDKVCLNADDRKNKNKGLFIYTVINSIGIGNPFIMLDHKYTWVHSDSVRKATEKAVKNYEMKKIFIKVK